MGYMVTGFALTPLVFGIPFGRLADRIGRKKVIYYSSTPFLDFKLGTDLGTRARIPHSGWYLARLLFYQHHCYWGDDI